MSLRSLNFASAFVHVLFVFVVAYVSVSVTPVNWLLLGTLLFHLLTNGTTCPMPLRFLIDLFLTGVVISTAVVSFESVDWGLLSTLLAWVGVQVIYGVTLAQALMKQRQKELVVLRGPDLTDRS